MLSRRQLLTRAAGLVLIGYGFNGAWAEAPAPKVYRIAARRFIYTPETLEIAANQPAIIELTVTDVLMGFALPSLHLRTDIIPGQIARINLPALPAGEVPFLCDVFCGSGHEQMGGSLHVV